MAALLAVGLGCAEDTSIRQYRIAKSETQRNATATSLSSSATPAKAQLMLAAIVPHQDFAWFFKLTGDPQKVLESDAEFRSMVRSVTFDGAGQPSWTLHEGWQQQITPQAITYGKLTNDEAGLTATVTRLPFDSQAGEDSWRGYIVSNINRWRNQLSLDPQEWEQMSGELEEFTELSQGSTKAYFVSLTGTGSGSMAAPFMNRGAGSQPPAAEASGSTAASAPTPDAAAPSTQAAASKPITYQVPEGWVETPASGMRMASFTISLGQAEGEVTVIAAGGGIEANIGIWLGQVGLESTPETTARILAEAEEVSVNSVATKLYTIGGPAAAATEAAGSSAAPANDAAAEDAAEETSAEETSAEETSAEETSAEETPAEETAAEGISAEEAPAEEAPAEETATAQAPAETQPATPDQAQTQDATAADAVTEESPATDQPSDADGQSAVESESESESETILIADIPWRDAQSLFVKFKGPTSLASSQREAFIEFVKSIEWN